MGTYPPKGNEDLVKKYEQYSHETLYEGLKAGDPNQVDGLVAEWKKIVTGLHDVNTNLDGELKNLAKEWSSSSGDEFHRRMGLISTFAADLATDIGDFHDTLQEASGQLREAKKHNEDPEKTDDNGQAMGGAAKGAAAGSVLGPVGTVAGGVIGGIMGHHKDEEQKQAAKNRMVQLVAELSGSYQSVAGYWHVPDPHKDTPGDHLHHDTHGPGSAGPGSGAGAPPGTHGGSYHDKRDRFDGKYHQPNDHGANPPSTTTHDPSGHDGTVGGGSVLTGAGAGPTGAGLGGGLDGGAGGIGSSPAGANSGGGTGGALFAGGGAGAAGGSSRSAMPRGMMGSRGAGGEHDGEEYNTWLTEDEEVWGGDEEAASGLLGGRSHADDKS